MLIIKHFPSGNGAHRPVTFVRNGDKCGYAWGFKKSEYQAIPTEDSVQAERGVTWHPDFYTALIAWAKHRENLETPAGGAQNARTGTPARRLVRKQRDLQSA